MGTAEIQHNLCLTCAIPGRRVQAGYPAISPVPRTPGGGALGRVPGVTLPPRQPASCLYSFTCTILVTSKNPRLPMVT